MSAVERVDVWREESADNAAISGAAGIFATTFFLLEKGVLIEEALNCREGQKQDSLAD